MLRAIESANFVHIENKREFVERYKEAVQFDPKMTWTERAAAQEEARRRQEEAWALNRRRLKDMLGG